MSVSTSTPTNTRRLGRSTCATVSAAVASMPRWMRCPSRVGTHTPSRARWPHATSGFSISCGSFLPRATRILEAALIAAAARPVHAS